MRQCPADDPLKVSNQILDCQYRFGWHASSRANVLDQSSRLHRTSRFVWLGSNIMNTLVKRSFCIMCSFPVRLSRGIANMEGLAAHV